MAIWIYPLVNYGKSQFLMGKSTISMAMASIAMLNYQRLWWAKFSVCNRPQVDCNVDPPVVGIFFDRKKRPWVNGGFMIKRVILDFEILLFSNVDLYPYNLLISQRFFSGPLVQSSKIGQAIKMSPLGVGFDKDWVAVLAEIGDENYGKTSGKRGTKGGFPHMWVSQKG